MDEQLRRLKRQAATGDDVSCHQWRAALVRAGFPDPDVEALRAPLTEWEESQRIYDDLAWQRTTAGRIGWDWEPRPGCGKDRGSHRGWDNRNSKRKTSRTHRNGKHKGQNYRLRGPQDPKPEVETAHARRRKKRFGGREHQTYEWVWRPETLRYRIVYKFGAPDWDE